VPLYTYTCTACGAFRLNRPMAESAAPADCPGCARTGRRVYEAPALRSLPTGLRTALDAQQRSVDAPEVTTALPARTGRSQRRSTDPRHALLPRP
jgi:putative FmdB family regulatory protein